MIREITTQLHTIFLLVGPSGCGKSTFAERYLKPQLDLIVEGAQIVSSDSIRNELIGTQYHKHDIEMLYVSDQAFNLLYAKVEALSSFPVNAPFIIVDTIGLSEDFRKDIRNIALKNQYHIEVIVFTYPDRAMYLSYLDAHYNIKLVTKHITRLNKEVLRELGKKTYNRVHRVRGRDFENYKIVVEDAELYKRCMLDNNTQYTVIGDIHGCLDELKELIILNKFTIDGDYIQPADGRKIILLGDLIDKGPKSRELLEFVCNNIDMFKIVWGNHENFIYKYFHKELDLKGIDDELIQTYFTSVAEFKDDLEALARLEQLYEHASPFLKGRYFYVSHAVCKNKYLGKLDSTSQRKQRVGLGGKSEDGRLSADDYLAKYEETHAYMQEEARSMHPYHIFGHDAFAKRIELKNKIGIDTGCVSGGLLSSVVVNGMDSLFFQAIKSKQPATEALARPPFSTKPDELKFIELTEYEIARINNLRDNKVNFIAGTISPAHKDMDKNDLESLEKALDYYKSAHVKQVMLQIKYMGSRCTLYLFKDIEKSYATSRNGYLIKQVEMMPVYKALHERLLAKMDAEQISMMIINGELL
ncbi:MAG: metallophosphoesterase, partial [Deferribacteraceae bacterium]|nr:metallophosphoesterase [Deferribacteraceae bacterium]